ncbi:hypothetical protein V1514DRAFT_145430 [Lipomyces japonicus]|uniref:uncharacterized protein n=1 Tax=Lipomyces japonicus TaxID=56871 RepID=UPI0034CFD215
MTRRLQLLDLPWELLDLIFQQSTLRDLAALASTCRRARSCLQSRSLVWIDRVRHELKDEGLEYAEFIYAENHGKISWFDIANAMMRQWRVDYDSLSSMPNVNQIDSDDPGILLRRVRPGRLYTFRNMYNAHLRVPPGRFNVYWCLDLAIISNTSNVVFRISSSVPKVMSNESVDDSDYTWPLVNITLEDVYNELSGEEQDLHKHAKSFITQSLPTEVHVTTISLPVVAYSLTDHNGVGSDDEKYQSQWSDLHFCVDPGYYSYTFNSRNMIKYVRLEKISIDRSTPVAKKLFRHKVLHEDSLVTRFQQISQRQFFS